MLHHTDNLLCPLCEEKLNLAHDDLVSWFRLIKKKFPNLHVSWSHRDKEGQEAAFEDKKSKLHWPNSAHNEMPASAIDLFQIIQGDSQWNRDFFGLLAEINKAAFPSIIWGGTFKSLGDFDHFELIDT